jgi:hypothetical protein
MILKSDGLFLPDIDKGGFPIKLYKYVMYILYSNTMHTTGQHTVTAVSGRQSDPPPPPQHSCEQHSKHPRNERAAQICTRTMAHWSFILLHVLMKHMQQQQSQARLQQPPTAFPNISNFSGAFVSPNPEVRFSVVAATLPKPSVKPWSGVAEG